MVFPRPASATQQSSIRVDGPWWHKCVEVRLHVSFVSTYMDILPHIKPFFKMFYLRMLPDNLLWALRFIFFSPRNWDSHLIYFCRLFFINLLMRSSFLSWGIFVVRVYLNKLLQSTNEFLRSIFFHVIKYSLSSFFNEKIIEIIIWNDFYVFLCGLHRFCSCSDILVGLFIEIV